MRIAVLAAVAAVLAACASHSAPSRSGPVKVAGWGQDAGNVARELGTCTTLQVIKHETALCWDKAGYRMAITTNHSPTTQGYLVAIFAEHHAKCLVVLNGVVISSPNRAAMTRFVGPLGPFTSRNGGYANC